MRVRVKICGIRDKETALKASLAGADAIGFVFANSPRQVKPEVVREITEILPPFVATVGVVANMDVEKVAQIAVSCNLDVVQLHGGESPEYCGKLKEKIRAKIIKSIPVPIETDTEELKRQLAIYEKYVHAFLFDTSFGNTFGGSGKTFNWQILQGLKIEKPWFLAGGLNPENVGKALQQVKPYGVDVSSGVEKAPGIKDYIRIEAFIQAVRRSENEFKKL
jgi:phosphoribosylanthranilate isomerase